MSPTEGNLRSVSLLHQSAHASSGPAGKGAARPHVSTTTEQHLRVDRNRNCYFYAVLEFWQNLVDNTTTIHIFIIKKTKLIYLSSKKQSYQLLISVRLSGCHGCL